MSSWKWSLETKTSILTQKQQFSPTEGRSVIKCLQLFVLQILNETSISNENDFELQMHTESILYSRKTPHNCKPEGASMRSHVPKWPLRVKSSRQSDWKRVSTVSNRLCSVLVCQMSVSACEVGPADNTTPRSPFQWTSWNLTCALIPT